MAMAVGCKPEWATFVHAAAGNTLEMDEGHAYAWVMLRSMPCRPRWHLALQRVAAAGRSIASLVAGYEVAARVGVATTLRRAVHPFGAWGVLGRSRHWRPLS